MKANRKTIATLARAALAVTLLAGAPSGLRAASPGSHDWPEFRGPTGQGISTATNVPLRWSADRNIVWKTPIPGRGWSSPVLADGHIYLTSATDGEEVVLRVVCVNEETGAIEWNSAVLRPEVGAVKELHSKNSLASPTPIVSDGRVFAHFGHLGTAALTTGGQVVWRQTSLKYPPMHGNGGSPALVGDTLVFSCDGSADPFVVALESGTGAVRWKTPRDTPAANKFSFATPLAVTIDGATQVILPGSGFVGAYDPADGRELWRARYGNGYSVVARPVFAHGLVFASSSFDAPVLVAVRPAGARGDVTDTHVAWTHRKGAPNTPSPVIAGDEIYFVSDAGIASCLDVRTGQVHWSERLGGGFSASPVLVEGRVWFINEAGLAQAVKAGRQFEIVARNDLDERTLASPAVADNTFIIRTESHLWRIGAPGR